MNDAKDTATELRTYIVDSIGSAHVPRLIKAKSVPAVLRHLALEQWTEPKVAKTEDFVRAINANAKVETA